MNTKKTQKQVINTELENKVFQEPKKYWYGKYFDIFSFAYWREYRKRHFHKRSIIIAVFLLNNGKYDMVTIVDEDGYFKYKNKTYVIDISFMREDVNTGLNMLFYYEGCSIPLNLEVDFKQLSKAVAETNPDIIASLNPSSLNAFIKSEVIKQLISSGNITEMIKSLKLLMLFALGGIAIIIYLILKFTGTL